MPGRAGILPSIEPRLRLELDRGLRQSLAPERRRIFNRGMTLPQAHQDVAFRRVGDEVVLVHLGTNQIYALNETGARFWELLTEGRTRAEILGALTAEFDATEAQADAGVTALLIELARVGMVETSAA